MHANSVLFCAYREKLDFVVDTRNVERSRENWSEPKIGLNESGDSSCHWEILNEHFRGGSTDHKVNTPHVIIFNLV